MLLLIDFVKVFSTEEAYNYDAAKIRSI